VNPSAPAPVETRATTTPAPRVLIAEDDPLPRLLLGNRLTAAGYDVVAAENGKTAWELLARDDAPELAIVDWMMPDIDGLELCRRLRARRSRGYVYVILLTSRDSTADVVAGLEAGADDYVRKPFDWEELHTRLRTGSRMNLLRSELANKVEELQNALTHVKTLQGLLPICMHCKSIRDDSKTWHRLESYIEKHSNAFFTHSLCAVCLKRHYPEYAVEETLDTDRRSTG
jgi:sigma-B regulation protein RsbU (phosphoserine phosphatase)